MRRGAWIRAIALFISAFVIVGGIPLLLTADSAPVPPQEQHQEQHSVPPSSKTSSACILDDTAVKDLQKSREELDLRLKDLQAKETDLASREKAVNEEMAKVTQLRNEIVGTEEKRKQERQEKVARMIETLYAMSPRSAAKLLSSVNSRLAVAVMEQMDTPRLAKIVNVMDSNRSSQLSEMMTGMMKTRQEASLAEEAMNKAAAASAKKGGGQR